MSAWTYQGREVRDEDLEGHVAFVYRITRKSDGKSYLGKKRLSKKVTRKPLKGKKRKRVSRVESDWRTYFGSNDVLNSEVLELGEEAFTREIIRFCRTLSESSYYEAKFQLEEDVLLHPDKFYNSWVSLKVHGGTLRHLK